MNALQQRTLVYKQSLAEMCGASTPTSTYDDRTLLFLLLLLLLLSKNLHESASLSLSLGQTAISWLWAMSRTGISLPQPCVYSER